MQQPQPSGHESVSEGCLRRMLGFNRESMYGEYNSGNGNLKPVPVVQILRWQADKKEWVVIDLVPETSEPQQSDKKTQTKTAVKDICRKSEGITCEPHQSEKMSSSKKTSPKVLVKNNCKKTDKIKTCFCFDWKEKVLPVSKCMKKINDKETLISNARIKNSEAKNNKTSPCGNILTDQRRNANPCEDETFENSAIFPPKASLIQAFAKTKNNLPFNPDGRLEGGKADRNSKGTCCKAPAKDAEADKVLKAAILMTEATIKTVEEMKVARKCDIVVKNMGYRADIVNEHKIQFVKTSGQQQLSKSQPRTPDK